MPATSTSDHLRHLNRRRAITLDYVLAEPGFVKGLLVPAILATTCITILASTNRDLFGTTCAVILIAGSAVAFLHSGLGATASLLRRFTKRKWIGQALAALRIQVRTLFIHAAQGETVAIEMPGYALWYVFREGSCKLEPMRAPQFDRFEREIAKGENSIWKMTLQKDSAAVLLRRYVGGLLHGEPAELVISGGVIQERNDFDHGRERDPGSAGSLGDIASSTGRA